MMTDDGLELFLLKCASLRIAVDAVIPAPQADRSPVIQEAQIRASVAQFSAELRNQADIMAEFYKLFYMLENDIRKLIDDTLSDAHGFDWWSLHSPANVIEEVSKNRQREADYGLTSRSEKELDYATFGQLGDVIKHNWTLFGGIISNQKALNRVMAALNNLRGPIAHCGVLADDEVDRLKLSVKDWFRLLEGPK